MINGQTGWNDAVYYAALESWGRSFLLILALAFAFLVRCMHHVRVMQVLGSGANKPGRFGASDSWCFSFFFFCFCSSGDLGWGW